METFKNIIENKELGSYSRGQWGDTQAAQDVPFVADGPEWHLFYCVLWPARQDRYITQSYRRDLLPGAGCCEFTLSEMKEVRS